MIEMKIEVENYAAKKQTGDVAIKEKNGIITLSRKMPINMVISIEKIDAAIEKHESEIAGLRALREDVIALKTAKEAEIEKES